MSSCAARDDGPNSAGMPRHLAPFWGRQTIAEMLCRRSFGGVLPRGRTASISGSPTVQASSGRTLTSLRLFAIPATLDQ